MTSPTMELPRYKVVTLNNPGAGAEIGTGMTGIGSWLILSVVFTFTTSAVVANRLVSLTVDDGTTVYGRYAAEAAQAASLANFYTAFLGSPGAIPAGNVVPVDFPASGIYLPAGYNLRTVTQNKDAGDAYTAIALQVIEFPTGPDYLAVPMPGYVLQPVG